MIAQVADIVIIGAGIAGMSLAARLATTHRVLVLEREAHPGTHATGRSAANWEPLYGPPLIRALTQASGAFYCAPPAGFTDGPLLQPRGVLMVGTVEQAIEAADAQALGYQPISVTQACALLPALRAQKLAHFLWDETSADCDVDRVLQGYLRQFRQAGGRLVSRSEVQLGTRGADGWRLETQAGTVTAGLAINAAGAWADIVAARLGANPLGLVPKRRSAAIVTGRGLDQVAGWAQLATLDDRFYAKPMGGKLMISPADADPVEPHDAWAENERIAEAVDRLEALIDVSVTRIDYSWAGLRTFAADGLPVVGWDRDVPGLFWFAGQGGYGIQTAPALSALAAALVCDAALPETLTTIEPLPAALAPERFDGRV